MCPCYAPLIYFLIPFPLSSHIPTKILCLEEKYSIVESALVFSLGSNNNLALHSFAQQMLRDVWMVLNVCTVKMIEIKKIKELQLGTTFKKVPFKGLNRGGWVRLRSAIFAQIMNSKSTLYKRNMRDLNQWHFISHRLNTKWFILWNIFFANRGKSKRLM